MQSFAKTVTAVLFPLLAACGNGSLETSPEEKTEMVKAESTTSFELPGESALVPELDSVPGMIPPGLLIIEDSVDHRPINAELLDRYLPCPQQAKEVGISGRRNLTGILDLKPDGTVESIFIVGGEDELGFSQAGRQVLKELRYVPGEENAVSALIRFDCGLE